MFSTSTRTIKVTSIDPDSPGAIGFLDQLGTVHPQEPLAFEIINGAFPELVNLKEKDTFHHPLVVQNHVILFQN